MSRMKGSKTNWDSNKPVSSKTRLGQRAKEVTDIKVTIGAHTEVPIVMRKRPVVGNAKPQHFVSLHHHSTF